MISFKCPSNKFFALLLWVAFSYSAAYNGSGFTALFDIIPEGTGERAPKLVGQILRNRLIQSGRFHLMTYEEMLAALKKYDQSPPYPCFEPSCLTMTSQYLPMARFVLAGKIVDDGSDSLTLHLRLYNNQSQTEGVKWDYSRKGGKNTDELITLTIRGAEDLLRFMSRRKKDRTKDAIARETNTGQLMTAGGLLLGIGGFYAWSEGALQGLDENDAQISGVREHPDDLSSLRGFFALPSIGASHRGMGGAGVASVESGDSPMLNPAGLAGLEQEWLNYTFTSLPGEIPSFFLSYSAPYSQSVFNSFGVRYEGDKLAGELTLYGATAINIGDYSPHIHDLRLGINLKGYLVSIGGGGTGLDRSTGYGYGFGGDIGLQFPLTRKIRAGAMLRDVFSTIQNTNTLTNREYSEKLPMELTVGFSYRVHSTLEFNMDGEKALIEDQKDHIRLGAVQDVLNFIKLRLGTHQVLNRDNSRYITFGFGAHGKTKGRTTQRALRFDYSFEHGIDKAYTLAGHHQFTLEIGF